MSITLSSRDLFIFSSVCTISFNLICSSSTVDSHVSLSFIFSVQPTSPFFVYATVVRIPSSLVENSDLRMRIASSISSSAPQSSLSQCSVVGMSRLASLLVLCSMLCVSKFVNFACVGVFALSLLVLPVFGITLPYLAFACIFKLKLSFKIVAERG